MFKKLSAVLALSAAATVFAAPAPAFADGPKTPEEAAVCKAMLSSAFPGLGQAAIDAICAVQDDGTTS
ncbi:hypothetical protein [Kitasatospora sp. DSM 101779]|uniref:hypothetical protein n=1 Tax=Kitasatospora sp. DSM 101779 TaxID=2853165 RepID=UPI0021DAED91|nr:hypothetical protein [Kitasatospora sp. DSM 101779]MCU7824580.1 hypothetical protein [Kitasatospora sp. DSM 101779]